MVEQPVVSYTGGIAGQPATKPPRGQKIDPLGAGQPREPTAATYRVYVHGFAVTGTANFTLFSWLLGSTPAGNMTVSAPAAAVLGATGTINLSFGALTPGTKYLGSVAYGGSAGMPNPTIVRVDP